MEGSDGYFGWRRDALAAAAERDAGQRGMSGSAGLLRLSSALARPACVEALRDTPTADLTRAQYDQWLAAGPGVELVHVVAPADLGLAARATRDAPAYTLLGLAWGAVVAARGPGEACRNTDIAFLDVVVDQSARSSLLPRYLMHSCADANTAIIAVQVPDDSGEAMLLPGVITTADVPRGARRGGGGAAYSALLTLDYNWTDLAEDELEVCWCLMPSHLCRSLAVCLAFAASTAFVRAAAGTNDSLVAFTVPVS
eukprot:m51a1_g913 hypothetical protein (255) ;mRNA; r:135497-136627